jgi:tRNA (guanosine-2'-O-)-methyltransferase
MEKSKRELKIEKVLTSRSENVVVLEDIHDPHNAAAVWRSCDAFGIGKVYLIFDKETPFNPKKVGKASSSSANKWIDFEIFRSTEECMKMLKDKGYTIYATVLNDKAKTLNETDFKNKKVALMLGNEHRGLSETAIKMANELIYIPMKGMVQSLNLSVTAGICLWELSKSLPR